MAALTVCSVAVTTRALSSLSLSSDDSVCCTTSSFTPRGIPAPGAVGLRRLVWVGQKSKRRTGAVASVSPVVVAADATAAPAESMEAVPRPKKIGKGIVRLRLTRLGRKKRPFFRIVATHYSWRRDGKYIELLGHYNPLHAKDDLGIVVKADRIKYWLGVGAQPSDTVTGILHKVGILKKAEPAQ
jgi:small subunit ribosomal protein S16